MRSSKRIRVLHCPNTIGGNPQALARAERSIGLESWSVAYVNNYLQYQADEFFQKDEKPLGGKEFEFKRWQLLMRAIRKFDVIHYNFGSSLMMFKPLVLSEAKSEKTFQQWRAEKYVEAVEMIDLPILKFFKKAICVTYQGDDARQKEFSLDNFEVTAANYVDENYYPPGSDKVKERRIATFEKYADKIYALNPDLLYVLPNRAEFLPYASVEMAEWQPVAPVNSPKPIILHAPTNRQVKGTDFIIQAIERLKAENVPLEFILVEGLSNADAKRLYEKADLLVDQLLIGWYGGLAVELMALGKPVICFIRQADLKFIPAQMRDEMPLINATPETVYQVLKDWLTVKRHRLPEVGAKGRVYVEKWHDPLKIAERLRHDYERIIQSK